MAAKKRGTKTSAGKTRSAPGGKASYLFVGKGGTLYVASTVTGDVRKVDKKKAVKVHQLLRQRQRLGLRIASELRRQGFGLDEQVVVNIAED